MKTKVSLLDSITVKICYNFSYDGVIELLNDAEIDKNEIDNFKIDFSLIEEIEDIENDFCLERLEKFSESFHSHLDIEGIVFAGLYAHENIKN
ncbi:hypothetical protein [Natranaerobius thermophilus]|uniref:Uncharacterized protein n=1 Tax=Natranaerobius thermophilus (strain ATCC BAA-1301 / DSM 18059 / JW/NM-WN-LF) TaxID=457570 RepID=B2A7S8_NATTJ|nr:hypothetical protein [Natranaerobius thermophilus]ACB84380.1 hypothetical protein Nther_0793 [Natranaerobius thermophilus JW/NM-WN-LF]